MRFLFILLVSLGLSAQQGTVTYKNEASLIPSMQKLKNNDSIAFQKSKEFAELLLQMDRAIQQELTYKNNEAIFKPILNEDDSYLLSLSKNQEGVFYKNTKANLNYCQKTKYSKTFKISLNPVEWIETDEIKTILDYSCIKAIGTINNSQVPDEVYKIEAWFTPKIPVSFGPKGYGDLPGLILELKVTNNHYIAIEIEKSAEVIIDEPQDGEKVTKKEYKQFVDDKFSSLPKF